MPAEPSPGSVTSKRSTTPRRRSSNHDMPTISSTGSSGSATGPPLEYAIATRLAESRTPRERARTLIVTREMPSTSPHTRKGSPMYLSVNCSWNPRRRRKSPICRMYDSR